MSLELYSESFGLKIVRATHKRKKMGDRLEDMDKAKVGVGVNAEGQPICGYGFYIEQ